MKKIVVGAGASDLGELFKTFDPKYGSKLETINGDVDRLIAMKYGGSVCSEEEVASFIESLLSPQMPMFEFKEAGDILNETFANKPPVGAMPKWLHEESRREALCAAIIRYAKADKAIPAEWTEEFNDLCNKLKNG